MILLRDAVLCAALLLLCQCSPGSQSHKSPDSTTLHYYQKAQEAAKENNLNQMLHDYYLFLRLAQDQLPYEDVPTLPGVDVDLAIVVDEQVTYEQLVQRISSAGGKLLRDVRLFDVYRDPVRVGEGKKSMAFSLTYRADDHTLTSKEVDKAHGRLVTKVLKSTGGEIRS